MGGDAGFAERFDEIGLFGNADPVLAGQGAADRQRLVENLGDAVMDLFGMLGIGHVAQDGWVQIAVAGMAVNRNRQVIFLGNFADAADHVREGVPGHGNVFAKAIRGHGADRRAQAAADCPDVFGFLEGAGDAHLFHGVPAGDFLDFVRLVVQGGRVGAVNFDDHAGGDRRVEFQFAVAGHRLKADFIHQLGRSRNHA